MSSYLTHAEIEGLLAPFALDAVDVDEREAVTAHLTNCSSCRVEVAEYRKSAATFGSSSVPGPDEWERLANGLD